MVGSARARRPGARECEHGSERTAGELVFAQAEDALRGGIAAQDVARGVAFDVRQRRALEERLQPVGALARALRRYAAHRDAMRELAVLALELLVEDAGEREQVVALDLQLESLLEVAVEPACEVHDGEDEEERHHALVPVNAALDEEQIDRGRDRRGERQRLVRALHRRVGGDRSGDEADDHHEGEELHVTLVVEPTMSVKRSVPSTPHCTPARKFADTMSRAHESGSESGARRR